MRKLCVALAVSLMLCGCGSQAAFESVTDLADVPAVSQMRKIKLSLPKDATAPTLYSEECGSLYLCDDYTISVQTLEGGDMDSTLRQLTGFGKADLTVMETEYGGIKRCSCVWSAAGEGGDHVGRALILDDGNYHYAVSVMAEFSRAGDLSAKWQELFESVELTDID